MVQPKGPGYALFHTPDGSPDGSLVEAERGSVIFGVSVAELDAALAEVIRLGRHRHMPATDDGWVVKAQAHDPAGNVLTLIRS